MYFISYLLSNILQITEHNTEVHHSNIKHDSMQDLKTKCKI